MIFFLKLLRHYTVRDSLHAACHSGLAYRFKHGDGILPITTQITMLSMVDAYIKDCFKKKSINFKNYVNFTTQFSPYIKEALKAVAHLQVYAALPELNKWKEELGNDKWRDLYVLIPTVWPVSGRNARQQIFEQLMDPDRIKTHIIKAEGVKISKKHVQF